MRQTIEKPVKMSYFSCAVFVVFVVLFGFRWSEAANLARSADKPSFG
jgi:hypothetical protein